eukprot:767337-Hanusia_phi.AAC.5
MSSYPPLSTVLTALRPRSPCLRLPLRSDQIAAMQKLTFNIPAFDYRLATARNLSLGGNRCLAAVQSERKHAVPGRISTRYGPQHAAAIVSSSHSVHHSVDMMHCPPQDDSYSAYCDIKLVAGLESTARNSGPPQTFAKQRRSGVAMVIEGRRGGGEAQDEPGDEQRHADTINQPWPC